MTILYTEAKNQFSDSSLRKCHVNGNADVKTVKKHGV